jgi:hypothetical protein
MKLPALSLIVPLVATFGLAFAVPKSQDPGAAQAEWAKKMAPAEQHKLLEKFVGDFAVKGKMWFMPDQPPLETAGEARLRTIMGGRFLQERYEADVAGVEYQGQGVTGFDTVKGKYTSTWIDTQSTFITTMEGDADAAGSSITLLGDSPQADGVHRMKIVWTTSADGHVSTIFDVDAAGKETKTMELVYTKIANATRFGKKNKADAGN